MSNIQQLEAVPYKDLSSVTKILNYKTTEYYMWIHLPSEFNTDWTLYEVHELEDNREIYYNLFYRENCKPWVRFIFEALNKRPGKHIYRLHLVNKKTDDVVSLYFSYVIQDDNPAKPYVYMNNSEGCNCV